MIATRIADLPMSVYHGNICFHIGIEQRPSISSSGLRTISAKSPAHYWLTSYLNPYGQPVVPTESMTIGRVAHWLILGEDGFSERFAYRPDEIADKAGKRRGVMLPWQGNRTVCRQWVLDQRAAGKEILTSEMVDTAHGVKNSIEKDHLVQNEGMLQGVVEESTVWEDSRWPTILFKSRADVVNYDHPRIVDMKLTRDSSKLGCYRAIFTYRYDMQLEFARWGFRAVTGQHIEAEDMLLMFIESTPPHCVTWVWLSEIALKRAAGDLADAATKFESCLASSEWGGYTDGLPVMLGGGKPEVVDD